jgi:hypothetical protein
MSPLSGPVLGGAAVVASPALWSALHGSMPMNVALTRYLIAVGICWALISLVVEFAFPTPGSIRPQLPDTPALRPDSDDDQAA